MKITLTLDVMDEAAAFALDLANTDDPVRTPVDSLADADAATAFLGRYLDAGEDPVRTGRDLVPFRDDLRRALTDVAMARDVAGEIERRLESALTPNWRVAIDKTGMVALWVDRRSSAAQRLSAWGALGFFALVRGAPERLRVCQSDPCEEVFRDGTKSGRQRFCSKRCATRFNVARYRSRRKS